jgi:cell fate regulator YaaT (PSP1 superfamily)
MPVDFEVFAMPQYVVRHGVMRQLGVFSTRGRDLFLRGDRVIARTHRGLEAGEVLCDATEDAVAQLTDAKQGQILRRASDDDVRDLRKMFEQERREYALCQQEIERLGLAMQLVDVEHLYGGERVVIYYLAEGRVDFRELVKSLANEYQTRVEMRQIGVRDEAKLLADYGDCGKPVCCNTHLSEMPPVSMKMAKLQRATLDPSKISGRCGRLKCCLRYEYETYQELQRELPPVGSDIVTNKGRARVLGQEILAGQILIETEDMRRIVIEAADVLTILNRGRKQRGDADGPKAGGQREAKWSGTASDAAADDDSEPLADGLASLEDDVVEGEGPGETGDSLDEGASGGDKIW